MTSGDTRQRARDAVSRLVRGTRADAREERLLRETVEDALAAHFERYPSEVRDRVGVAVSHDWPDAALSGVERAVVKEMELQRERVDALYELVGRFEGMILEQVRADFALHKKGMFARLNVLDKALGGRATKDGVSYELPETVARLVRAVDKLTNMSFPSAFPSNWPMAGSDPRSEVRDGER